MEIKTDIVTTNSFNTETTKNSILANSQNQFGQISSGPYMPIESGSYHIDVIATDDFHDFEVLGHY